MNQFVWIFIAVIFAVLLDLYVIRSWRRYRRIRQDDWSRKEKVRAWFGLHDKRESDPDEKNGFSDIRKSILSFWAQKTTRAVTFFSGVGFIVSGQYLMSQTKPIEDLLHTSQKINELFRIDVDNLDNVIAGVLLILLGGILFALSTRDIVFKETGSDLKLENKKPIWRKPSRWFVLIAVGGGLLIFLLIRLFSSQANFFDTIIWGISIGAFFIAALWWDRSTGTSLKINLSPSEIIELILILALGLIVGVYQLQNVPNLLMGDEGSFFETARSLTLGTYHPTPFDLGVYSYPVLSSFWQAGIIKFFGISLWSWRFASVLPAVLTVIPLYLLSKEMFGRSVGIVSSLVLIVSPYFLAFSRMGYNNSQSIFVVTLCIGLVYFGVKKESMFYAFLGGTAAGLGFLTYTAGRLGFVVAILYFTVLFLAKSAQGKRKFYLGTAILPFVVGAAVMALPSQIYTQQQAPESARIKMLEGLFFQVNYGLDYFEADELFEYAAPAELDEHAFFYNPQVYAKLLVRGAARTLLAFHHDGLVSEHFISDTLAGPVATVFYTFGCFFVFGRLRDQRFLLLVMWFVSGLFFLSIINTYPPRHQHLVPIIPVIAIMIAIGIVAFLKQGISFITTDPRTKLVYQLGLGAVIILAIGVMGLREYFVVMPTVYRPHLEQMMNWFGLHNSPEVNFVLIHTEPVHEEWRPYLFRDLLSEHKFTLVDAEAFLTRRDYLLSGSKIAVFYQPDQAEQITLKLLQNFPNAQKVTYLNREQQPVAEAILQGDIVVPHQASFLEGLLDVFTSPAMWLLVPLLFFAGYYGIKHQHDLTLLPLAAGPESMGILQAEMSVAPPDGLPAVEKQPSLEIQKGTGFFEIGFFIRFSSGDSVRRFEPKFSCQLGKEEKTTSPENEAE